MHGATLKSYLTLVIDEDFLLLVWTRIWTHKYNSRKITKSKSGMHGATYFVYQRALSDRIFNPISSKLFIEIEIITQELEFSNSEAAIIFAT